MFIHTSGGTGTLSFVPKYTLRASKLKKTDAYLPIFMIVTINVSHKLSSMGFAAAEDTIFTPH